MLLFTVTFSIFDMLKILFLALKKVFDPKNFSPTSGRVVTLETGRREVPGSKIGRSCRLSRSEFSVVFSETRLNTG